MESKMGDGQICIRREVGTEKKCERVETGAMGALGTLTVCETTPVYTTDCYTLDELKGELLAVLKGWKDAAEMAKKEPAKIEYEAPKRNQGYRIPSKWCEPSAGGIRCY